jgi:hypothetical protein
MGKKFGLASLILAIINCIISFAIFEIIVGPWTLILPTFYVMVLIAYILSIVGLILGIIGTVKDKPKIFAIIGIVLSIFCLGFILFVMPPLLRHYYFGNSNQ